MGIEKFGTDAVELNTATGGVVSADGAILLDTSSTGASAVMVGPNVLREVQAGIANGTWASTPPNPDDAISANNPLPYFDYTDSSSSAIVANVVDSTTAPGGKVLRFTIPAATYGSTISANIKRFVPVAGSLGRSFAYSVEASLTNSSGTGGTPTVTVALQFYKADQTTTVGTAVNNVIGFASASGATVYTLGAPSWSSGIGNTDWDKVTVPSTAAYALITLTVSMAAATVTVARTIDVSELRLVTGQANVLIPDLTAPGTYSPAGIWQDNGELTLQPQLSTSNDGTMYLDANGANFTNIKTVTVKALSTSEAGQNSTAHAFTAGVDTSGKRVKIDTDEVSAFDGSGTGVLNLNPAGGNVAINTDQTNNYTVIGGSTIQSTGTGTGSNVLQTFVTSDANNRYKLESNGKMSWGPGSATVDTVLYRNTIGQLKTDTDLVAAGSMTSLDWSNTAASGSINSSGTFNGLNANLTGTQGLRHDTPATTSGTGQIAGEAMWVLVSGTNYQLRRSTGTSWAKFKDDIAPTSISPEQFAALDLVQFKWNAEKMQAQFPTLDGVSPEMQHGVLLDQLSEVLPEAVQQPQGPGDTETVNWHIVHMAAMVALKDALARIGELERRVADLER